MLMPAFMGVDVAFCNMPPVGYIMNGVLCHILFQHDAAFTITVKDSFKHPATSHIKDQLSDCKQS